MEVNSCAFKSAFLIYIIKKSKNLNVIKIIYFLQKIYILYVATDILSDAIGYLFVANHDIFVVTDDLSYATDVLSIVQLSVKKIVPEKN